MKLFKAIQRKKPGERGILHLSADHILTSTEGTVFLGVQADEIVELLKASETKQTLWHNLNESRQETHIPKKSPSKDIAGKQEEDPMALFTALQKRYPESDFVIKLVGYQPTPLQRLTTQIAIHIAGTHKLVPNLNALEDIHLSGQPLSSFLAPTLVLNLDGQVVVIQPELEAPTIEQLRANLHFLSVLALAAPRILKEHGILLDFIGTAGTILASKRGIWKEGEYKKSVLSSLPAILSNLKWDPIQGRLVFIDIIAASLLDTKKTTNSFQRLLISITSTIQFEIMAYIIGILRSENLENRQFQLSPISRIILTLARFWSGAPN